MKSPTIMGPATGCPFRLPAARRAHGGPALRSLLLTGIASAAILAGTQHAAAETLTWSGGGGTGNKLWGTPANWQGAVPTSSSDAIIAGGIVKNLVVRTTVNGAAVAKSLELGTSGSAPKATLMQVTGTGTLNLDSLTMKSGAWLQMLSNATDPNAPELTVGTLNIQDKAILDVTWGGLISVTGGLTLAGNAQGPGKLVSAGPIVQTAGRMGVDLVQTTTYEMSGGKTSDGRIEFSTSFKLSGDAGIPGATAVGTPEATIGTTLAGGAGSEMIQSGGTMAGVVIVPTYSLSGGTVSGKVDFSGLFALAGTGDVTSTGQLVGSSGSTMTQAGGTMSGTASGVASYDQSGGTMAGAVTTATYSMSGGVLSGNVAFSDLFMLSGDGDVTAGAELTAADGATLLVSTDTQLSVSGIATGESAFLVKQGTGSATLIGDITLGGLQVSAGWLIVGNGTSTNTASFDAAGIAQGATLFVAKGATLTVRIPNNIINNGQLINEGTVNDDLDNAGAFANDGAYNANLASNTSTINNNTPGVWTGNVETNAGTINNNAGAQWLGNVETNTGGINNAGTWLGDVITNVGNIRNYKLWTGDVLMNTYQSIHNSGSAAFWTGDVDNNSQIVNETGATWSGDVLANNNVVFNFENSFWIGDVVANGGGPNTLAQIDNYGDWAGVVRTNAGMIFNLDGTWTGDVLANTDGIYNNHLDINRNPTGANAAAWVGNVATNAGTIVNNVGGTWSGNVLANTGAIVNNGVWTGDFNNAGTVIARNIVTGDFINSGILRVTGDLSGIGDLTNTGSIDLRGAGAVQTLMVDSVSFSSGAFFKVDVDDAGHSDRMVVAGTAELAGTVRLAAASTPQVFTNRTDYTILTAGLIDGTFDAVSEDYAFLDANLSYTSTAVKLALVRNDQGFTSAGTTSNQQGVAAVVEAFGAGDPLYDAIVQLNASGAAYAFDQLSGDAQTSIESATLQSAGLFGDLGLGRIDASFDVLDSTGPSNYVEAPLVMAPATTGDSGLWGQVYGARGTLDSSGSTLVSTTGGVAAGVDGMLGDWRLGMMMQVGMTGSLVDARSTNSSSTDYGLGVYGGTKWGDTRFSLGGNFTRHDTLSTRHVVIGGFTDTLTASYAAGTSQVFGQVSQEFDLGALSFTPYAGLSYAANATDAYSETGGPAALSSSANVIDATFASLGVGIDQQFVVGEDMLLTAEASIGWRRTFANTPSSTHALAGGTGFEVLGAPLAVDLVTVGAGVSLDLNAQSLVNLTYDGQFGVGTETHSLKGTFANRY